MRLSAGLALAFSLSSLAAMAGSAACSDSDPKVIVVVQEAGPGEGGTGAGADAGPGACGAETTSYLECRLCCGLADDAVAESYAKSQEAFQECLCEGPCKDICATTGCSRDPDAGKTTVECDTCLRADESGKTCFPAAQAVCDKDPACTTFQACDRASNCNAKED